MTRVQEIIVAYVKTQWDMSEIKVKCQGDNIPVSYTHLTLPTILLV